LSDNFRVGQLPASHLSDTEFVRHGSSPTKSGVVRLGFVGQPPCRTTSVSDNFLHLQPSGRAPAGFLGDS